MPRVHRAQKISFCPDCGKRFANETRVLQHMNQPSNACGSWTNDLSNLHCDHRPPVHNLKGSHPSADSEPHRQPTPDYGDFNYQDSFDDARQGNFDDTAYHPTNSEEHRNTLTGRVVDSHPNTPSVYPGGTTFMDQFFNDECAGQRKENLYYPFASGAEWQLASWLLRSRLSMAAIDDFLSLQLVR
jgi:hypothetical protein